MWKATMANTSLMAIDFFSRPGFKMAKLFPVDSVSAVAELYYGDLIWAYVSLNGIDDDAVGTARVAQAEVVVEFWREPGKPTGRWDFNLSLDGALDQLQEARQWLLDNEAGRAPSEPGLHPADEAFQKMSEDEQNRWLHEERE